MSALKHGKKVSSILNQKALPTVTHNFPSNSLRFGDLGKTIYHPIDQSPSGVIAMQRMTQRDGSTIKLKRKSVQDKYIHGKRIWPHQESSDLNRDSDGENLNAT